MKSNLWRTGLSIVVAAMLLSAALSGCSMNTAGEDGEAHSSRVKLYPSIESLAGDSAAVVVGTVREQRVAADIDKTTDFTLSTIEVSNVQKANEPVVPGEKLIVRQLGSQKQTAPGALMEVGTTYLLYLTPSGLDGELGTQFYITGANAGLYQAAEAQRRTNYAPSDVFKQVEKQDGESLPEQVTLSQAIK